MRRKRCRRIFGRGFDYRHLHHKRQPKGCLFYKFQSGLKIKCNSSFDVWLLTLTLTSAFTFTFVYAYVYAYVCAYVYVYAYAYAYA